MTDQHPQSSAAGDGLQAHVRFVEKFGQDWLEGSTSAKTVLLAYLVSLKTQSTPAEGAREAIAIEALERIKSGRSSVTECSLIARNALALLTSRPDGVASGGKELPDDVRHLVIAARLVCDEEEGPRIGRLLEAVEAFSSRVPYDDEPEPLTAAPSESVGAEPFGYWVEQKHADPVLLRKPAYIPEPSDIRTVTPLYTAAPSESVGSGEALARRFHDTYERLAPSFGYETRDDTKQFDPTTANGRLMIAVCSEIAGTLTAAPKSGEVGELREAQLTYGYMPSYGRCDFRRLREAVSEATCGVRNLADDPDDDTYPGHAMVVGINYNSLSRIVSAFVAAALAKAPPGNGGEVAGDFLKHLREVNSDRLAVWESDSGARTDGIFHAAELGGEVGEVLNVVKKLHREEMGWRGSRATNGQLSEEIGDVLICLDKLAAHYGIDIADATIAKFNATSIKVGLPHKLALSAMAPATGKE